MKCVGGEARANVLPLPLGVPHGLGETEQVLKVGVSISKMVHRQFSQFVFFFFLETKTVPSLGILAPPPPMRAHMHMHARTHTYAHAHTNTQAHTTENVKQWIPELL